MKDAWYDFFVRKNEWIRREYERYVIEHIEEHDKLRFLHWLVLLRLNWHYRILRKRRRCSMKTGMRGRSGTAARRLGTPVRSDRRAVEERSFLILRARSPVPPGGRRPTIWSGC